MVTAERNPTDALVIDNTELVDVIVFRFVPKTGVQDVIKSRFLLGVKVIIDAHDIGVAELASAILKVRAIEEEVVLWLELKVRRVTRGAPWVTVRVNKRLDPLSRFSF